MAKQKRVWVEEYDHAYLIHGTLSIDAARKALWKFLGKKKWSRIIRMPYRPLWAGEDCVAMYFAVGPGGERKYKP